MVPPSEFVAIADETGLILPINRALLEEACRQLLVWQAEFPCMPPLTVAMNIAPRQFAHPNVADDIGAILRQTGLDPGSLEVEILETVAMGNPEWAGQVIANLKALGVRLSIDDFGTGYSSLSRLQRLPVDKLKVDRSFISDLDSIETREIVRIILMLAHSIGLKVVAEGVETQGQLDQLKGLGCDLVQGYLLARPEPPEAITELMRRGLYAPVATQTL
jgi:EAL domain-containing protein (putative c-di-GMP-specific phosphodiesterase class I)